MGLILLVDSLVDDYTQSWTKKFAEAFDLFRLNVAQGAASRYEENPTEYWQKYGQLTRANSDRAESIERRHQFFIDKMYAQMKPQLKDPTRSEERRVGKECR